ncbi:MAG: diguanylate cyclase, partial [Syntrophomonadaceae bacterium]|nr:diguanylate cyclase [Syntrophomonadaceae bacterium]
MTNDIEEGVTQMSSELCKTYGKILTKYLLNPSENSLYQASRLSSDLVRAGIGPDEIVEIHLSQVENSLQAASPLKYPGLLLQSFHFLLEVMIAYGIIHREYFEKKGQEIAEMTQHLERIRRENEELDRRSQELKVIAQISQTLLKEYLDVPEAMARVAQALQSLFANCQIGFVLPEFKRIIKLVNNKLETTSYNHRLFKPLLKYKKISIFNKYEKSHQSYKPPALLSDCLYSIWIPIVDNNKVIWAISIESSESSEIQLTDDLLSFLDVLHDLLVTYYQRTSLIKRLSEQAEVDELTGLFNYRYLLSALDQAIKQALRYSRPLCVMILDLDNFKLLNDRLGHLVGDLGLKSIAKLMRNRLRSSDILCRYGGDEFVIVLPETTLSQACIIADNLRTLIESFKIESIVLNSVELANNFESVNLTASIGIAAIAKDNDNAFEILKRADQALYLAKNAGRNQ